MTIDSKGGIVTTDDAALAARLIALRAWRTAGRSDRRTGTGSRLDESRAASGIRRLSSLRAHNERRRELAALYTEHLRELERVIPPHRRRDATHTFSSYIVNAADAGALASTLRDDGIPVSRLPLATEYPAVRALVSEPRELRIAERLTDRLLALPLSPAMSEGEVVAVCDAIERHYERAEREPDAEATDY